MYDTIPTPLAPLGAQWVDPLPLRGIVQSVFPTVKVTHRPTAVELREYSGLCVRAARYKSDGSCPLPPGLIGERTRAEQRQVEADLVEIQEELVEAEHELDAFVEKAMNRRDTASEPLGAA